MNAASIYKIEKRTIYKIKKRTTFFHRFPSLRNARALDCRHGAWILFGDVVSQEKINKCSYFLGRPVIPVMAWQAGPYEVLLIRGEFTEDHRKICDILGLDCASLENIPFLYEPGLALFDMDSTAIQMECIDEIAKFAGVGARVAALTEQAMRGELDFEQSLKARVAALKGTDISVLEQVQAGLRYTPGMAQLTASLHARGWKVGIASGGFTLFSDRVKKDLSLDFAKSNQLVIEKGKLTGELTGKIVDAQLKADILHKWAARFEIPMCNTLAVGDGANDLLMMNAAGLGVAYHAKPKVKKEANVAISHADLGGVFCVLSASLLFQRFGW